MAVVCLNFGDIASRQYEREPRGRKALANDDELSILARSIHSRAFELPDGSIGVRFRMGDFSAFYGFSNREHAQRALELAAQNRRKAARITAASVDAAEKVRVHVPDEPVQWSDLAPARQLDYLMHGEVPAMPTDPETYLTGFLSPQSAAVELGNALPARTFIRRLGPEGQLVVEMFERLGDLKDRTVGEAMGRLEKALENVPEEEIAGAIYRHAEGGEPLSEAGQRAWTLLNSIADEHYAAAQATGVRVAKREERYFPHVYNVGRLADPEYEENLKRVLIEKGVAANDREAEQVLANRAFGTSRERAVRMIIESHKNAGRTDMTRAEAEHILDRFIKKNQTFVSGHLERERLASIPPIENARTAYAIALSRNARRVAEAQVLGANYEKMYRLIDTIEDKYGTRASGMVKKLLDLEVGRVEKRLPTFMEDIFTWQAAKLSLSVLANSTQTINVPMVTGLKAFARGLLESTRQDLLPSIMKAGPFTPQGRAALREHIQYTGALANEVLDEIRFRGMDALLPEDVRHAMQSPIRRVVNKVEDFSLRLFNYVEAFNRAVSQRAGEAYFEDQMKRLARNPADRLASLRLRELRINPESAVALLGDPNGRGLLDEMKLLAGKRVSDISQFRTSNIASRGLWAQHPLGRAIFQFKTFAIGQAELVGREVIQQAKKGDYARLAQTLSVLALAMPATGVALTKAREGIFGATLASDQVNAAFNDPTFLNILAGGIASMTSVGALGIMADIASTAYVGNKFALQSFFIPPIASTAINAVDIGATIARGLYGQDVAEFERAIRTGSREFGGFGAIARQALEQNEIIATPEQRRGSSGGIGGL